jgi:hypothetical protein
VTHPFPHAPLRTFSGADTAAHVRDTWFYPGYENCFEGRQYNTCPDDVKVRASIANAPRPLLASSVHAHSCSRACCGNSTGRGSRFRPGPESHELRVYAVPIPEGTLHGRPNGHHGEQVRYVPTRAGLLAVMHALCEPRILLTNARSRSLQSYRFFRNVPAQQDHVSQGGRAVPSQHPLLLRGV